MKILLFFSLVFFYFVPAAQVKTALVDNLERSQIAKEMENAIHTALLNVWYPQSVDTLYGGFLSTYTYDFKPTGPQDKFIVSQSRHTWTTAKAAELCPQTGYYLAAAKNGFQFLRDVMWDKTYGGFYNLVDRKGKVINNSRSPKDAYGNAFGIYALSAYYKASRDTASRNLAIKAFLWLEQHSHDPVYYGYFQHLQRDGKPIKRDKDAASNNDIGYKDQNSSIHLLEAFTELYEIWPDERLRLRLQEMLLLIRDTIVTGKGYMSLFFKPDWTPISFHEYSQDYILKNRNLDHVSFGHDVETAYLMLEASHALGLKDDTITLAIGKKMTDHALKNGWDNAVGGFYDEGYYFKESDTLSIILDSKNWWAQAEGLNTLLLMADLFPNDPMHYFEKFKQQWNYIQRYVIDYEYGDWYAGGLDKEPGRKTALKGHIWKATYHQFRALANCVKRLQNNGKKED